jgi:phospholipase/carboxylesterase
MAFGMINALDGPRLPPASGRATALIVLLHGYGANGDDLIGLAQGWRARLPGAAFVAPNAPQSIPGMMGALQWFALTLRDPHEFWQGVVAAAPGVDRFLDQELARLGIGADRLALVGFSQGTMLALHVGVRRGKAPAAIVGYSGLLAGPERLSDSKAAPPFCSCTAKPMTSFPSRRCIWRVNSWPPGAFLSSGTCGRALRTASMRAGRGSARTSSRRP